MGVHVGRLRGGFAGGETHCVRKSSKYQRPCAKLYGMSWSDDDPKKWPWWQRWAMYALWALAFLLWLFGDNDVGFYCAGKCI